MDWLRIGTFIPALISGVISAIITSKIALKRFQGERWWEKKASIYAEAIWLLYEYKCKLKSEMKGLEIYDETDDGNYANQQNMSYLEHLYPADFSKIKDVSIFYMSEYCSNKIINLFNDLMRIENEEIEGNNGGDKCYQKVHKACKLVDNCISEIRIYGRKDLGVSKL